MELLADSAGLDAAVTLLHGARTARPEDRTLTCWLAQRLAERGDHHDDVADLAAAITSYADPGREPLDDPAAQAMAWYALGLAHLARWRLAGADVDRDRAEAHLAVLVDLGPPDVGLLLDTHFHRLQALDDRVQRTPDRTAWERSDAALRQVEVALDRAAEHIDRSRPIRHSNSARAGRKPHSPPSCWRRRSSRSTGCGSTGCAGWPISPTSIRTHLPSGTPRSRRCEPRSASMTTRSPSRVGGPVGT